MYSGSWEGGASFVKADTSLVEILDQGSAEGWWLPEFSCLGGSSRIQQPLHNSHSVSNYFPFNVFTRLLNESRRSLKEGVVLSLVTLQP